jgi:hypothetical protein
MGSIPRNKGIEGFSGKFGTSPKTKWVFAHRHKPFLYGVYRKMCRNSFITGVSGSREDKNRYPTQTIIVTFLTCMPFTLAILTSLFAALYLIIFGNRCDFKRIVSFFTKGL